MGTNHNHTTLQYFPKSKTDHAQQASTLSGKAITRSKRNLSTSTRKSVTSAKLAEKCSNAVSQCEAGEQAHFQAYKLFSG